MPSNNCGLFVDQSQQKALIKSVFGQPAEYSQDHQPLKQSSSSIKAVNNGQNYDQNKGTNLEVCTLSRRDALDSAGA